MRLKSKFSIEYQQVIEYEVKWTRPCAYNTTIPSMLACQNDILSYNNECYITILVENLIQYTMTRLSLPAV